MGGTGPKEGLIRWLVSLSLLVCPCLLGGHLHTTGTPTHPRQGGPSTAWSWTSVNPSTVWMSNPITPCCWMGSGESRITTVAPRQNPRPSLFEVHPDHAWSVGATGIKHAWASR
jgi:hypothetical protein